MTENNDDTATTEQFSETEEKAVSSEGKDPSEKENSFRDGDKPEMGSFPDMGGASQKDNTTAYILLGDSALFLLLGLGFAMKFKR